MAATAAMRSRLRRMANEPTTATYSDDTLDDYIEAYPINDSDGNEPDESDWTATYDLNAAAADIWSEKAATYHDKFDYSAAGEATYQRSTKFSNSQRQAAYYNARRVARSKKVKLAVQPTATDGETDTPWIANVNDPYA